MNTKSREVFEKMSRRFRVSESQLTQDEDGCYLDKETQSHWVVFGIAWAESRDALVIDLPIRRSEKYQEYFEDVEGGSFDAAKYFSDVKAAIEAAGVKVRMAK